MSIDPHYEEVENYLKRIEEKKLQSEKQKNEILLKQIESAERIKKIEKGWYKRQISKGIMIEASEAVFIDLESIAAIPVIRSQFARITPTISSLPENIVMNSRSRTNCIMIAVNPITKAIYAGFAIIMNY